MKVSLLVGCFTGSVSPVMKRWWCHLSAMVPSGGVKVVKWKILGKNKASIVQLRIVTTAEGLVQTIVNV